MEMLSKVIWFYIVVIQPQHLPQFGEVMRGGQLLNDFFKIKKKKKIVFLFIQKLMKICLHMCIIIYSKMVIPFTKNKLKRKKKSGGYKVQLISY